MFFETRSLSITLAVLKLTMQTTVAWNSEICLSDYNENNYEIRNT